MSVRPDVLLAMTLALVLLACHEPLSGRAFPLALWAEPRLPMVFAPRPYPYRGTTSSACASSPPPKTTSQAHPSRCASHPDGHWKPMACSANCTSPGLPSNPMAYSIVSRPLRGYLGIPGACEVPVSPRELPPVCGSRPVLSNRGKSERVRYQSSALWLHHWRRGRKEPPRPQDRPRRAVTHTGLRTIFRRHPRPYQ